MTAGRTDTPRPRTARALALAGAMGLAVLLELAWERHERRIARLQDGIDTVTRAVLAMPHDDSRVDPVEAKALRDWSRRDGNDDLWPGVARRESPDRPPSEGGLR